MHTHIYIYVCVYTNAYTCIYIYKEWRRLKIKVGNTAGNESRHRVRCLEKGQESEAGMGEPNRNASKKEDADYGTDWLWRY